MSLPEYIYVDDKRLDAYVEQIGPPLTIDKVPVWTAKVGLTALEASGTQQNVPRSLRRPEKINLLLEHLKKHKLLGAGRFVTKEVFSAGDQMFRLETCSAIKAFIPPLTPESMIEPDLDGLVDELSFSSPKDDQQTAARRRAALEAKLRKQALEEARATLAGFDGLNIWLSDRHHLGATNEAGWGQLFLVVGFPHDDTRSFNAWSAYSAFTGLLSQLRGELDKSVLHSVVHERDNPNSDFQQSFLADPVQALYQLGARFSTWRKIETLYRVRDAILYREPADGIEAIATIGYPIFIAAAGF